MASPGGIYCSQFCTCTQSMNRTSSFEFAHVLATSSVAHIYIHAQHPSGTAQHISFSGARLVTTTA